MADKDMVIKMWKEGKTGAEIAEKANCSRNYVYDIVSLWEARQIWKSDKNETEEVPKLEWIRTSASGGYYGYKKKTK